MRVSVSVDLDLTRDALDILAGCWKSPVFFAFLLRVRHTELGFDSDSDLLFSRLMPNPNFFRSDEALELSEPVLNARFRFNELDADAIDLPSSGEIDVSLDLLFSSAQPERSQGGDTIKEIIVIIHNSIK